MIQNIKKSIFMNIYASFIYIELLLIILYLPLSILGLFFKIFPILSFVLFPICTLPLGIACLIGAFYEIKDSKTNGFIVHIPDKIINSLWYNILFWIGLILSTVFTIFCNIILVLSHIF